MTVAAVLLAYAVGVGTIASRLLGRARWTVRAPLLAMATYLAAAWSVVAALALAGLTLAVHATALGGGHGPGSGRLKPRRPALPTPVQFRAPMLGQHPCLDSIDATPMLRWRHRCHTGVVSADAAAV